jgi:LmbE family N-acetylglucosaminyl deacetylase
MPFTVDLAPPASALAIAAHPDDVEFGCGATLAKWAAAGCSIRHLVCTDGSKGTWDPGGDPAGLVKQRQEEQRAASRALGGRGEVFFLGWPDGELESGARERQQVAIYLRRLRPEVVLGHDPWQRYRLHPDHRNAGFITTDAIVAARDPLFLPELELEPHRPSHLLLFEADEPDHLENVGQFIDQKVNALLCHRSQLRSTMHVRAGESASEGDSDIDAFRRRVSHVAAIAGATAGLEAAEAFKRIDDL